MQNYQNIEEVRVGITPLIEQVTQDMDASKARQAAGDLLTQAFQIRRGDLCRIAAGQMCGTCADLTVNRPICQFMNETGMYIPPSSKTSRFVADI